MSTRLYTYVKSNDYGIWIKFVEYHHSFDYNLHKKMREDVKILRKNRSMLAITSGTVLKKRGLRVSTISLNFRRKIIEVELNYRTCNVTETLYISLKYENGELLKNMLNGVNDDKFVSVNSAIVCAILRDMKDTKLMKWLVYSEEVGAMFDFKKWMMSNTPITDNRSKIVPHVFGF